MQRLFYKLAAVGTAIVVLYTVVGFLVLPFVLRRVAVRELTKALKRNVTIREIQFNPYALSVTIQGLQIAEQKGGAFLYWKTFYANFELWSSLLHRTWVFKEGALAEPHVNVVRNADGTLNFADLLLLDWPTIPDFRLRLMRLTGGTVIFHDAALPSRFSTTLGPLTGTFKDFSMTPDHKNSYSCSALSEAGERFSWKGFFRLDPLSSHGELSAEDVQVRKYYPYFEKFLDFRIEEGTVTARAIYDLDLSRDHFKALLTDGTISTGSLQVLERESGEPFFGFKQFTLNGATVDLVGQTIHVTSIAVTGGSAALRRRRDHAFNIQKMIRPLPSPSAAKTAPSASWHLSVDDIRVNDFGAEVTHWLGRETIAWKELRLLKPTFQTSPPIASIAAITLTDGRLIFTDPSVTPPVKMALTDLDVRIGSFSSASPRPGGVAVSATIDRVASLQISGESNPIHKQGTTKLRGLVQNVNLVPLSPYSEKYVGYSLTKGELSLDVNYMVRRRKLTAHNKIELDHLTLGDRTASKDATTLPVHLAVALLKDSNDKITIHIPIEGTLDDPKFQLTKAVFEAVLKPVTTTAASPFTAFGAQLGGGGEELGFQQFSAGSTQLIPKETRKLDTILKGLIRWPALMLDIDGSIDPDREHGNFALMASARAKAVKEYLLRHGEVKADRIFLIDNPLENVTRKGSRAFLHVK